MNLIDATGAPSVFEAEIDGKSYPLTFTLEALLGLSQAIRKREAANIKAMGLDRDTTMDLLSDLGRRDYFTPDWLRFMFNQNGLAEGLKLAGVPKDVAAKATLTDSVVDAVVSAMGIDPIKFRAAFVEGEPESKKAAAESPPGSAG